MIYNNRVFTASNTSCGYNYKELAFVVFSAERPQLLSVNNFYCLDLRRLIDRCTWLHIIYYLDVENMFVCLLGTQMHMTLRSERIERLKVENEAAEPESRHFIYLSWISAFFGVDNLVPD